MPRDLSHRNAALLLAFCAICWSIAGVFTRHLERADGFEITFWRSFFCAVAMIAILAWQRRGNPLVPVVAMGWPGLFSGFMWSIMFTCFMLAITRTSVANTLLVLSVSPLLAALLGRAVLGNRLSPMTWAAIGLAGFGIWWMVRDGVSADGLAGMLIAAAVPVAAAVNIVTLKKLQADVDLAPAVLIGALLSCLFTLPLAWPLGATSNDLAILALLGVIQLAVPCFLMIRATRSLAPHEVALIALLEVVFGPIWAWLGAGEAMPPATIQGGLVVLAALVGNALVGRAPPPAVARATA
ncbi:DMT family transporter [Burkholderiaceae bacterium FT117]|uniref:DMT family transporter n=1 Tax=Zeimonas sediminis TaxID=2944268 RepID=UPI002342D3B1|nr:DMT family transporter [Zeimonas sediminis]MCM5570380.1 DMT family transporter [Zeimonas sediminis]